LEIQIKQTEANLKQLEQKSNKILAQESDSGSSQALRINEIGILIDLISKYGLELEN